MKKRLLLVEDDPDDAALFAAALAAPGAVELIVASDGQQALELLLGGGPVPDLVVLDLQLPRVTGLEVLQRLRALEKLKLLPVVVFSSSREPSDRRSCYAAGVNSFLRKPVGAEEFERAVRAIESYWLSLNEPPAPL
jgi:CheY-like chemotaxis protein